MTAESVYLPNVLTELFASEYKSVRTMPLKIAHSLVEGVAGILRFVSNSCGYGRPGAIQWKLASEEHPLFH